MEVKPELISELINGSRKAQRELFDLFYKPMMRVSRVYCHDEEDAKSVVMEGFMDVFNNIKQYNHQSGFKTWFNKIVVNRAINQYNKNKKINLRETGIEPIILQEKYDSPDESMDVIGKMSADEILLLIRNLPDTEQMVFTLHVMNDYSHKQIAEELGLKESTSRWHFSNARKRLQEKLVANNITTLNHARS